MFWWFQICKTCNAISLELYFKHLEGMSPKIPFFVLSTDKATSQLDSYYSYMRFLINVLQLAMFFYSSVQPNILIYMVFLKETCISYTIPLPSYLLIPEVPLLKPGKFNLSVAVLIRQPQQKLLDMFSRFWLLKMLNKVLKRCKK